MSQSNLKEEIANVDLRTNLSDRISQLFMSQHHSDVVFIVEGEKLPAHKCILAAGNNFFERLLYGDLLESNQKEIELPEVPLEAFEVLLRFIYSGRICLKDMEEETVLSILVLANKYGVMDLEVAIVRYLKEVLALENLWAILKIAWYCELKHLKEVCYNFLDINASELLAQKSFNGISEKLLQNVLRRDSFLVPEFEIFAAVRDWYDYNPDGDINSVLSCVRFPLMNLNELAKVRRSGMVKVEELMDAVEVKSKSNKLPYRVLPEENMIALKFGTKIIQGSWEPEPPSGDIFPCDPCKSVKIKATSYEGIIVELGITSTINHIEIELEEKLTVSYFLEVSTNQSQWERVVDYRDCNCKDLQSLFFPPKSVKYIKLVGTSDKGLTITGFKATYAEIIRKQINGFIAATIDIFAEDGEKPQNSLLNQQRQVKNELIVKLDQPYYVGTLRVFLSRYPDWPYNYSIKVSTNDKDWWSVANKNDQVAISWQNISFPPCPVVYIKISTNRYFGPDEKKLIHFDNNELDSKAHTE